MVRVVRISDFYADDMNETKVDGHLVTDLGLYKKLQFKEITCDLNIYFYNVFNTLYSSNIRVNAFGGRMYEHCTVKGTECSFLIRSFLIPSFQIWRARIGPRDKTVYKY